MGDYRTGDLASSSMNANLHRINRISEEQFHCNTLSSVLISQCETITKSTLYKLQFDQ